MPKDVRDALVHETGDIIRPGVAEPLNGQEPPRRVARHHFTGEPQEGA
jgi:hypothetical protein